MMRRLTGADRGGMTLLAVLCVAAATPLVAQQDSVPVAQAGASAVQASSATATTLSTSTTIPRLRPEWQPVEPSFASSRTARAMAASGDSHTITVTTLVLVLLVVIAVLLIT
jgi:hypothetical protein